MVPPQFSRERRVRLVCFFKLCFLLLDPDLLTGADPSTGTGGRLESSVVKLRGGAPGSRTVSLSLGIIIAPLKLDGIAASMALDSLPVPRVAELVLREAIAVEDVEGSGGWWWRGLDPSTLVREEDPTLFPLTVIIVDEGWEQDRSEYLLNA